MPRLASGLSLIAALLALVLLAIPAGAQQTPLPPIQGDPDELDEAGAFMALSTTPVGGLAPLADMPGVRGTAGRLEFHGQFGFLDEEGPFSTRNLALGFSIPGPVAVFRLTGGIADFMCDDDGLFAPEDGFELDCGLGFFGGVDATVPLIRPVLAGSSASSFSANLVFSLGASSNDLTEISFEDPFDPSLSGDIDVGSTTLSLAVGVPLAFVVRSEGITVIPHLTPRIGYGRAKTSFRLDVMGDRQSDSMTGSDALPMLGAGVDILFGPSGFALGVGAQKVFADDAETLVGINLSFRR